MPQIRKTLTALLQRTPLHTVHRWRQRRYALRTFWTWTEEDKKKRTFYQQLIPKDALVFDVGANLGNRTKIFSAMGLRVVAFEPQLSCRRFLESAFQGRDSVRIDARALGPRETVAEMMISNSHTVSSLSLEWVRRVRESGRFGECEWSDSQSVQVTTLDRAINDFGTPAFIKIDVEGYESQVLAGLSVPVPCISIEFTPEHIEDTFRCIDHMASLAPVETRFSLGESMQFAIASWVSPAEMKEALLRVKAMEFGDVYLRCLMQSAGS